MTTTKLRTIPERSVLMHARGHAYYRTACPDGCCLASKWAVRRLITPRAFLTACRTGRDWDEMAEILGVTPADVSAYLAALDAEEWRIMLDLTGRHLRSLA